MKILKYIYQFFFYYFYLIKFRFQIGTHIHLSENVRKAKLFSLLTHHKVRQTYDNYPYYFHTYSVAELVLKYSYLLDTDEEIENTYIIALLHDVIEDCRLTYNDVKTQFNVTIADGVFSCTETRGKNRKERHNDEFFNTLKQNQLGTFVKLCDNYSNILRSKNTCHSMFNAYTKEYPKIKSELYCNRFSALFTEIENLLEL